MKQILNSMFSSIFTDMCLDFYFPLKNTNNWSLSAIFTRLFYESGEMGMKAIWKMLRVLKLRTFMLKSTLIVIQKFI